MRFKALFLVLAVLTSYSLYAGFPKEIKRQKYENASVVLYSNGMCELVINTGQRISLNLDNMDNSFEVKDFAITNNGEIKIYSTDGETYEYSGIPGNPIRIDSYPGRIHAYQTSGDGSRIWVRLIK